MQMGLFGPKRHTDRVGDVSEAAIATRFLQVGYGVLTPYGKQHRYDLVIEDADGRFWRIQCKTAWVVQDGSSIAFNACSSHYSYVSTKSLGVHKREDYRGQVDYFAAYCEATNKVYLVPVDDAGLTQVRLRLLPTKNKQEKNVRWAADYEL
jgi:hypothetical protein